MTRVTETGVVTTGHACLKERKKERKKEKREGFEDLNLTHIRETLQLDALFSYVRPMGMVMIT